MPVAIDIPMPHLEAFCQRWRITEMSLFGSVLRADFSADSDVDVLVTFAPDAAWSLLDHVRMTKELSQIFARPVDLVQQDLLENPFRRREILSTKELIYAA